MSQFQFVNIYKKKLIKSHREYFVNNDNIEMNKNFKL